MLCKQVAGGNRGSGLVGELECPKCIASKPGGGLYVADDQNHRILFFEDDSREGRVVAGGGQGSGLVGELDHPNCIAIKPGGGLYVADSRNNRILFFEEGSTEGRVVVGGELGNGLGKLSYTCAIAIKPGGGLYVADSGNHRVLFFEEGSTEGRVVAGGKKGSSLVGELSRPYGIAITPSGGFYVADSENHRVLFFEDGSTEGRLVAGGKNGNGLAGELYNPHGIAIKPGGGLYVGDSDNSRVLFFEDGSTEGSLVAGGERGSSLAGELCSGFLDIAINPGGGLYVADPNNHRVLFFPPPEDVDRFIESVFLSKDILSLVDIFATCPVDNINSIASKTYVHDLPIEAQRQVLEKAVSRKAVSRGGAEAVARDARGVLDSMSILWGFSQMEQLLDSLDDDIFTHTNSRPMLASHLLDTKTSRYGRLAIFKDSVLPSVDYALDNLALVTYVVMKQYDFLAIVATGILFNVCASSLMMISKMGGEGRYGKASLGCHVLTLGLYGLVAEARHCSATGKKTELLTLMKMTELVESMFSFMVSTYSIFIAGYLTGFKKMVGYTLILRYLSVISSLCTLPLGAFDFSNRRLTQQIFDLRKNGKELSDYVRSGQKVSFQLALGLYHATEVQFMLSLLVVQLATRPFGIFIFLAVYWLAMSICMTGKDFVREGPSIGICVVSFLWAPLHMIVNPIFGGEGARERNIAIVRFIAIFCAWASMFTIWSLGFIGERVISQLTDVTCLPLLCIAVMGSILHPVMILQQWCAGRFEPFERTERAHPEYQRILNSDPEYQRISRGDLVSLSLLEGTQ